MSALLDLAARCEAATGPDRLLDALIGRIPAAKFLGVSFEAVEPMHGCAKYTASLDAATSLATDPELTKFGGAAGMLREAMQRLAKRFDLHMNRWPSDELYAEWLARYLTAACLRARAQ